MSVVRRYGDVIFNFTRLNSVAKLGKDLHVYQQISNHYTGNFVWMDDNAPYKIRFNSKEDAEKELVNIQDTLNKYYLK